MSVHAELYPKPINELLGQSFVIPAYQRGYRWSRRQVTELLEDVYEFSNRRSLGDKEFYCLQPVVVKQKENAWELVDGQQRLTTILLILRYFNSRFSEEFRKELYSLEYETRANSQYYLHNIDEKRKDENVDFYHIYQAFQVIRDWFKDKANIINDIESVFLNRVKVIWYQVADSEDVIDVFTRLNIGKIPLVNAELVKALFLRSANFVGDGAAATQLQQLQIAQEWDAIERRLQDDEFWYFISNDARSSNRIELILDLASRSIEGKGILEKDPLRVFLKFNRKLSNKDEVSGSVRTHVVDEWLKIKKCFMTLDELYNDKTLYHLVGYLIAQGDSVADLFDLSSRFSSKQRFRKELVRRIVKTTFNQADFEIFDYAALEANVSELSYEGDKTRIRNVLLLFNMASLLANPATNARFPFDKFKNEKWDIEHIKSVASDIPSTKGSQRAWLEDLVHYISSNAILDFDRPSNSELQDAQTIKIEATELLNQPTLDEPQFQTLYERVLGLYDPDREEDADHSVGNLTLLDRATNRSYKNALFPIKRAKIISLDKQATFVPLCTRNVFLKYYSKQIDRMMFWEKSDGEYYLRAIIDGIYHLIFNEGARS